MNILEKIDTLINKAMGEEETVIKSKDKCDGCGRTKDQCVCDDENKEKELEEKGSDKETEKSLSSEPVYLDIDQFVEEVVQKAVKVIDSKYDGLLAKSHQSERVDEGLLSSIAATIDRVENIEKSVDSFTKIPIEDAFSAIAADFDKFNVYNEDLSKSFVNLKKSHEDLYKAYNESISENAALHEKVLELEKAMLNMTKSFSNRKSALSKSEMVKHNSLDNTQLSKSEVSSMLLDQVMKGNCDPSVVIKFESAPDLQTGINSIPDTIQKSMGIN